MRIRIAALILLVTTLSVVYGKGDQPTVLMPVADDPTVSFRILFKTGSQNDPPGKQGLAALTASVIAQGSSKHHSYEEILELMYPMATSISDQVDKEVTVFSGRTHVDNLDAFYALFKEVILEPAFTEEDFTRIQNNMLNYVRTSLRYSQDEELGKEALYEFIFAGTPYEHNEEGYVASLSEITLDDVKKFYRDNFTHDSVVIGIGGGFAWDFQNPPGASVQNPTHTFTAQGTFTVTLVVTDNLGLASAPDTHIIVINPPTFTLTVTSPTNGSVASVPPGAVACPGDCSEPGLTGSVTLAATPSGGFSVGTWSEPGCAAGAGTCVVDVDSH